MPREDAVGQVYGFMVAGVIFVGAIMGLIAFSNLAGSDPKPAEQAGQDVDAEDLMGMLTTSLGSGWNDPDSLSRLGLADPDHGLNATHLGLLNDATLTSIPGNDLVEYEDARVLLGLEGDAGFQLRVIPIDYDEALQDYDFSHIKALYIGDWASLSTITLGVGQGTIPNANAALNTSMAANTALERTVIDTLGVDFDNEVHLTTTTPAILVQITTSPDVKIPLLTHLSLPLWNGDVLFDDKQYLGDVLPGKLATGGYDLLVLGSGIDHSTLTAKSVKDSVDVFIDNGGTMMVFGSPGANFNWMQPIMDISAVAVTGEVTAPDPDHPVLATPWAIDWESYNTNGLGWTLGVPASFDNVLMQGGKPVIAISHPGALGDGMLFLSSIQPRSVAQDLGANEAMHYMFNLLLYDMSVPEDPTIVFGPDPPEGVPVSSAVRTSVVQDASTLITVRVELLSWSTP